MPRRVVVIARTELFANGITSAVETAELETRLLTIPHAAHSGPGAASDATPALPDDARGATVVLVEWNGSRGDGWALLRALRAGNPEAHIVLSALPGTATDDARLAAHGVDVVIPRAAHLAQMRDVVRDLVASPRGASPQGEPGSADAARAMSSGKPARPLPLPTLDHPLAVGAHVTHGLTPRQRDVVDLICSGADNAEIARRLSLSINSVKSHIRGAYRVMGVTTRPQAVLWGVRRGFGSSRSDASHGREG